MHTNPNQTGQNQPKTSRLLKLKTCPGCGLRKTSAAFRALKPGEPFRAKIRCRRCERHGGASLRREHRREQVLRTRPEQKFCRRCDALKPLAEFPRDRRRADGRSGVCLACRQAKRKTTRKEGRKTIRKHHWSRRRKVGLAIAHATCPPGHQRTLDEIAAYCGCDEAVIRRIEEQALAKVLGPLRKILRKASMHVREVRL